MGCGLSKQEEEDDVVALCRERKRLLKLAVERRYSFADAQFKYNQSLYGVAVALRLFVARHSSASSPFLITFPDAPNQTEPKLEGELKETQNEKKEENFEEEEEEETGSDSSEDEEEICDHFYDEDGPPAEEPRTQREFGWDFFYPFDEIRTEFLNGLKDEDLKAVREKEGIPELEAVNVKKQNENGGNLGGEGNKEVKVIGSPAKGRDLLEALQDIADHFVRAHESGLDISRMLEANRVHLQSGLEEIKESSNKLLRSITWNRSASFRSSPSCRSLSSSSPTSSSRWTEFNADVFDEFGMKAGSHSLTLARLYAWEKKLFEEVKAGEETRKIYEKKCSHLRKSRTSKDGSYNIDKSSSEVKELHSRISVAVKTMESISNRIEKLRDEELQPQFLELLQGLTTTWKTMLELHETQSRVILEVKPFNSTSHGKFSNDSHRLATLQLEAELDNWRACIDAYISTQRSYMKALCGWLSNFGSLEGRPPLLITCQAWLAWLEKVPDKAVNCAIKSFGKEIRVLWSQQGNEQQQKRKVDSLARELEKRNAAFQREERRVLKSQDSVGNRIEYLAEGKRLLDLFKKRLDEEKEKHVSAMQKTRKMTVSGFQTGFCSVFESLVRFSELSVEMYADLVTYISRAKTVDKYDTELSYVDMIN